MSDYFDENDFLELRTGAIKELKVKLQEVDMVLELCEKKLGLDMVRQFREKVKVKLGSRGSFVNIEPSTPSSKIYTDWVQKSQSSSTPMQPGIMERTMTKKENGKLFSKAVTAVAAPPWPISMPSSSKSKELSNWAKGGGISTITGSSVGLEGDGGGADSNSEVTFLMNVDFNEKASNGLSSQPPKLLQEIMKELEMSKRRKRHANDAGNNGEASASKRKGKNWGEDNLGDLNAAVELQENVGVTPGPEDVLKQIEGEMNQINTGVSTFEYCIIDCRIIRVGSYKVTNHDAIDAAPLKVAITTLGISLTLPSSVLRNRKVKFCIPKNNIVFMKANLTKRLPAIFLKTGPKFSKWMRDVLGMDGNPDNDSSNYYCPQKGSNSQRTIVILAESFSEADVGLLRKLYADTMTEIDYQLANKFFMDMTIASKTHKTRIYHEHVSDSPVASVSTATSSRSSSDRINNATGDHASAYSTHSLDTTPATVADQHQEVSRTIWIYEGQNTKIPICPKDIRCLGYSKHLNDQIIDLWLSVIYSELLSEKDRETTFVYDSFFYTKLSERRLRAGEDGTLTAPQRRHARVKNRTKSVDIFEKNFLIVPVNDNGHWSVAIICFPGMQGYHDYDTLEPLPNYSVKRSQLLPTTNKPAETRVKHPSLFLFDAKAGGPRSRVCSTLWDYLTIEYKSKKGVDRDFDRNNFPGLIPKVPQQRNSTDSGLFMLQYIESFFSHPLQTYNTKGIHLRSWFEPLLAEKKRKVIYDFIKMKIEEECPHHLARIPDMNFAPDQCEIDADEETILMSSVDSSTDEDDDPDAHPGTLALANAPLTNATT